VEPGNKKTPEQIWHNEVGAPVARINEPLKGYVLTPQAFSSSNLALGPMLHCSGSIIIALQQKNTQKEILYIFKHIYKTKDGSWKLKYS
jgi:hypothetical protein